MFLIDFEQGRIVDDEELKNQFASAKPYRQWIDSVRVKLDEILPRRPPAPSSPRPLLDRQQAFGYTQEDLKFLLSPMAQAGEEGIGSMGNDSPLAVLSATRTSRSTTTSSSCSRRSRTRRSIRSAKRS